MGDQFKPPAGHRPGLVRFLDGKLGGVAYDSAHVG
jgi:hypothetical protein